MDIYFPYIRVSTHGHVQNHGRNPPKPFLLKSSFWNISIRIFSINYRKIPARHTCYMWWSYKISSQPPLVCFTKIFQNPLCPDSNLNNFTLWSFFPWPQTLWACSKPKIVILHQVVDLGEVKCMPRSTEIWFCWFLGFYQVTLWTFFKCAQTWWSTLILPTLSPCSISWQENSICLPKH